jgi:hypothetical protein
MTMSGTAKRQINLTAGFSYKAIMGPHNRNPYGQVWNFDYREFANSEPVVDSDFAA